MEHLTAERQQYRTILSAFLNSLSLVTDYNIETVNRGAVSSCYCHFILITLKSFPHLLYNMRSGIRKTSLEALEHRLKSCHVNRSDFISVAGNADFGCLFASVDYLLQSEIICFGSFVV